MSIGIELYCEECEYRNGIVSCGMGVFSPLGTESSLILLLASGKLLSILEWEWEME